MTREEAKKELSKLIFEFGFEDNVDDKVCALNMAIQALLQEPISLNDINNALEASFRNGVRSAKVEQEPCDDTISRKKAIYVISARDGKSAQIEALEQLPSVIPKPIECDDAVSRMALGRSKMCEGIDCYNCPFWVIREGQRICRISEYVKDLPPVTQKSDEQLYKNGFADGYEQGHKDAEQKSGKCKNCKYFEYNSVAKVDGIPLIVAHEICNKWGGGCKTSENGYCYLFEPQKSEE